MPVQKDAATEVEPFWLQNFGLDQAESMLRNATTNEILDMISAKTEELHIEENEATRKKKTSEDLEKEAVHYGYLASIAFFIDL